MIALPIVGVSAADLTLRSAELSPDQAVSRVVGASDARVSASHAGKPVYQLPDGSRYLPVGGYDSSDVPSEPREEDVEQVAAALPPGSRFLKDSAGYGKVRTRHGLLESSLREIDLHDPLAKGLFTLDRGRLPERAGEVVATNAFLKNSGLFVGSSVTPRGATSTYKIVGAYELPNDLKREQITAPPGSLIAPLDKALKASGDTGLRPDDSYLVKVGGAGFTWNMVQAANAKSLVVVSRAVANHPPADADVPLYRQEPKEQFEHSAGSATEMAILATIVGLAMLEICLLAGPAFAVGARRSRRQLGLVGANGGDRRHIRSIVLSGGLVIGAAAAVSGTAIGITLTVALQPVLEEQLGNRFGDLDFRPLELAGIAVLAVVTGLLSAIVPAVTASRQTVLASLTGRRGVRRSNRVLPVIGLVAVAGGAAIALYGSTSDTGTATVVAGGSALAELGIVALTPFLVGLFGRLGRWLPLSPRLALRDAVRNRGRTAPAVAAVLAAVAGTVAVATYQHSSDIQSRHEYVADLPHGTGRLLTAENSAYKDVPALRESLTKQLPVAQRADVERLVVGMPGCDTYSREPACGRAEIITPKDQRCPLYDTPAGAHAFSEEEARRYRDDWRCKGDLRGAQYPTVVADEKLLSVLGVTDPDSVSALRQGLAVAFDKRQVKEGKLTLRIVSGPDGDDTFTSAAEPPGVDKTLPVHLAPEGTEGWGLKLVLPPAAVQATGLTTAPIGSYFALDGTASSEQRQRVAGDIDRMGVDVSLRIEAGYQGDDSLVLLALTVFAGLVTIGAAGIATGLSQADAEADLKTLAAVGAPPRVRRTLSGFQCGVVALMGVVLGSAAGILPAVGLRLTQRRDMEALAQRIADGGHALPGEPVPFVPIAVPWETLAQLLVLVPLGAALLAALVTRSSGALARRAAG
ncbi:ABC transporter permease [Streptomyces sp. NPDC056254]|uniref:ABC transporter permease n=1 Tax=Streptomyces sp. NPDC056254 TaxID=3345763 RepID=UPI0035E00EA4